MSFTLTRIGLSNVKKHPWQMLFLVLGVTLGVAVIVAIDIANQSADRSFSLSLESISGKASHRIVGSAWGVDEDIYTQLKTKLGLDCAPIITGYVDVVEWEHTFKILGIDVFAEMPFRSYLTMNQISLGDDIFAAFSQKSNTIIISQEIANKYAIKKGDRLHLEYGGKKIEVTIIAFLNSDNNLTKQMSSGVIIADIATAQEILDYYGRISHIDLLLNAKNPEKVTQIKNLLPTGVELEEIEESHQNNKELLTSFQLNLTALSLLAILIGAFIIYDTITFSVIRRRHTLGVIRSVGATKQDVFKMIIAETFVLSLLGWLCGFFLGIVLGKFAVYMVTQTINDLYFTLTVTDFTITTATFLKSFIGIGIALLAAFFPALEATKIPPLGVLSRSNLETKITKNLAKFSLWGIFIFIIGVVTLSFPSQSLTLGFGGIFFLVLGVAFCMPIIVYFLMKILIRTTSFFHNPVIKMAPRNIKSSLSRTTIAIAALTVAVSCLIAISIMIGSFRQTFIQWIDAVLVADIYISGDNKSIAKAKEFSREVMDAISKVPGVKGVYSSRITQVKMDNGNIIKINAVMRNVMRSSVFLWVDSEKEQKWGNNDSRYIIISESLAYRLGLQKLSGQYLSLFTDEGLQNFEVVGIYSDYASDRGRIMMADNVYRHYWKDQKITAIAVFLQNNNNDEVTISQIEKALSIYDNLIMNKHSDLRKISLEIFERTFAITFAMQILVGIIAFIAITSTLMALQLERKKEIGILRANGMTPTQLGCLIFCETGIMGGIAGIVSIPLGTIIAIALIDVINVRSFGWTIHFYPQYQYFAKGIGTAILAAILAGIYPTWLFITTNIAKVLREE